MHLPVSNIPTSQLVEQCQYIKGSAEFFKCFGNIWDSVQFQVLKLETRQYYQQPENRSFEAWQAGDYKRSIELLEESVSVDHELYKMLRDRSVDMIRCRPVKFPISEYLQWELKHYDFNSREGERIFCCPWGLVSKIFESRARHDFMVFDNSRAMIHDYDKNGLLQGGWITENPDHIAALQALFIQIKSQSIYYKNIELFTNH